MPLTDRSTLNQVLRDLDHAATLIRSVVEERTDTPQATQAEARRAINAAALRMNNVEAAQ